MKSYILLRDNRESGPYTLKDLKALGLFATDLIWIEGESTSWQYPSEISGLESLMGKAKKLTSGTATTDPTYTHNLKPVSASRKNDRSADLRSYEISGYQHPTAAEEKPVWQAGQHKGKLVTLGTNLFGLGVLAVGLTLGAFVVKNIVEHFGSQPSLATAQAIEIRQEVLPVSTSANMAKASQPIIPETAVATVLPVAVPQKPVQKPASEETVKEPEVQDLAPIPAKTETAATDPQVTETPVAKTESLPKESPKDEKTIPVAVVVKPSTLTISANEYKVGMFGGISDLELSINNPSPIGINRAVVEVEFLKPNGNVIKSQTLSVENIAPGAVKKLAVPSSNRGVKVRYRIVQVNA